MYKLIKKYEGFKPKAYKCPAGIWTLGYGTTILPNGDKVTEFDYCNVEEAEMLLDYHIHKECYFVFDMDLTDNQKDAVTSLVYNVGKGAFLKSNLYRAILNKDYKQVCKNWDWYSAGGNVLKGLVKRRTEELFLFCKDI